MRALALLFAIVLLGGCSFGGGDESGSIQPGDLQRLVLQPEDLPRVFLRFDEGRQGISDMPGRRADQDRFGRQEGWKARYRRTGTRQTRGPLVIASLVDVFESTGGAEEELGALEADFLEGELDWRPVDAPPEVGDEAFAMTLVQGSGQNRVSFFLLAWRDDNVVASLDVSGFGDRITLGDALSLARKQASRIAQAAGS